MNAKTMSRRYPRIALTFPLGLFSLFFADIVPAELERTKSVRAGAAVAVARSVAPTGTPLAGQYNVGVGGVFSSLTNAGGAFEALNLNGASSGVFFNIISNLTAETGAIALEEVAGSPNVVIRPAGAARTITGSNDINLIRFNGTDNVTIEGSLTAGTASGVGGNPALRNLTIQNTSTTASNTGAVIAVTEATSGALNFTIRNTNIFGQGFDQTFIGLFIGGNAIAGSPSTASNDNARVENCSVQKAGTGLLVLGRNAMPATGNVITMNDLSATGVNRLRRLGISFSGQDGIQVTANSIGGITGDVSTNAIGIATGNINITATNTNTAIVTNALIARNKINGISTPGSSAAGIAVGGNFGGPNTVVNNTITGVSAPNISPNLSAGIFIVGSTGSDTRVYHNSITMTGDRGAVANQTGSYAIAITGATIPLVDLRNNIFYTSQTSSGGVNSLSYVLGTQAPISGLGNLTSDYNDFFITGNNAGGFRTGGLDATGTDFLSFVAWRAATGRDLQSLIVNPNFVSPTTNLHLVCVSPVRDAGISLGSVPDDIDGELRHALRPEIGADEVVGPTPISVVSRKTHGGAGTFEVPLPLSGNPGIESRSGGVTGTHQIAFTFATTVTISNAVVSAGLGSVDSVTGSGTGVVLVNLSGVTNAQYVTVRLNCASNGVNTGDVSVTMGFLLGDTNGSGSVSSSDIGQTKSVSGQAISPSNFRAHVNLSGTFTSSDIGQVKAVSGTALP